MVKQQLAAGRLDHIDVRWIGGGSGGDKSTIARRLAAAHGLEPYSIAGRTSDPPRALDNLLERDALFTDRLRASTSALGLHHLSVTAALSEDDLVRQVGDLFGL